MMTPQQAHTLARRAAALMDVTPHDSFGPTDAVRALDEYDAMSEADRRLVRARLDIIICDEAMTSGADLKLKPADAGPYTVTGFKPFASPDGGGYNATLRHAGKIVAKLHDGGHGGQVLIDWTTHAAEDAFDAHVAGLADAAEWKFDGYGLFISRLIDQAETRKESDRIIKQLSTRAIAYTGGKDMLTYRPSRPPGLALAIEHARTKHPGAIVLNSLTETAAREIIAQWQAAT